MIVPNDRRGTALARQRNFPEHITRLVPVCGSIARGGAAVLIRSAPVRPARIGFGKTGRGQGKREESESKCVFHGIMDGDFKLPIQAGGCKGAFHADWSGVRLSPGNADFSRQHAGYRGVLPDKSGVPRQTVNSSAAASGAFPRSSAVVRCGECQSERPCPPATKRPPP
jgi:hypothetical protein